ncbi:hypothetical protein ACFQZ4_54675 [Catellatospora coxensis]
MPHRPRRPEERGRGDRRVRTRLLRDPIRAGRPRPRRTGLAAPAPEKIQAGIDTVPIGTNFCLRTITISGGHYSVVLSEMRPGQPATQFTQTITTKQIDGRWFVDVIT